jgi:hypothetical protein
VEALPARQIGVEATGRVLSGAWEYGYSAYVSNGRTATHVDFTEDKAIGARLRIARQVPVPISFGASAYYGQIDETERVVRRLPHVSVLTITMVPADGVDTLAPDRTTLARADIVVWVPK